MTKNSRYRLWLTIAFLVVGILGYGMYVAYRSITSALWAENNLHTMCYVVGLIDQFVTERGHWPKSWEELQGFPYEGDRIPGKWPNNAVEVKRRTIIDFEPNLQLTATQDRMQFDAVKPIGPTFEWRDYGDVAKLQATLKQKLKIE